MKIRPKMGEALLYMDAAEAVTHGGIIVPEQHQLRSQRGQVRALGIWKLDKRGRLIPHPVKAGDRVIVSARRGRWMHSERERLKLVDADDILAVIDDPEK